MSEWWTYTLTDFLLFSPATYYRLLELHNRALWPAQLLALVAGIMILVLMRRRGATAARVVTVLLAAAWASSAWTFQLQRYASINWAATYFAWAFFLEAVLLVVFAARAHEATSRAPGAAQRRIGFALAAFAVLAMPVLAPASGRTWAHAEIFGVSPDPTAIATLGVLLAWSGRRRSLLIAIPLAWCAVSGATLLAMQTAAAAVPLLSALVVIAVMIRPVGVSSTGN